MTSFYRAWKNTLKITSKSDGLERGSGTVSEFPGVQISKSKIHEPIVCPVISTAAETVQVESSCQHFDDIEVCCRSHYKGPSPRWPESVITSTMLFSLAAPSLGLNVFIVPVKSTNSASKNSYPFMVPGKSHCHSAQSSSFEPHQHHLRLVPASIVM